jgi:voltage-dependent potassium channel beta subunit
MQYRQLGRWGLRVSALGLGSYLTIGMKVDETASREVVRAAYEAGINYYDTANAYNRGEAERVLGRCLAEYPRESLVVLTKVFAPMGEGPNDRGLSAKHIREQCEASLRRLGMDYVDIYMCHRPDPTVPMEETVRAMEDLARQGKIIYWGVSEWTPLQMADGLRVARELNARPLAVHQPRYNLLWRYPEQTGFPFSLREGIGNVVFSSLAHGMLTGKYRPGERPPAGTRASDPDQNSVINNLYWNEENLRRGQALMAIAKEAGTTAAALSIAWCLRHGAVSSVILGARTAEQVQENLRALDVRITPELEEQLDALYPAPSASPAV